MCTGMFSDVQHFQELIWGPKGGTYYINTKENKHLYYIPPTRTTAWEDAPYTTMSYPAEGGTAHAYNGGGYNVACASVRGSNLMTYFDAEVAAGVAGGRGTLRASVCLRGQNLPSDFGFMLTAVWVCLRDWQEATLLVTLEKLYHDAGFCVYQILLHKAFFAIHQRESWGGLWVSSHV